MSQDDIKPKALPQHAVEVTQSLYGLTVLQQTELAACQDRNFHILVDRVSSNPNIPHVSPHGYVLKFVNSVDSQHPELLDAEIEILQELAEAGIVCPKYIKNKHGEMYTCASNGYRGGDVNFEDNLVLMLEYIPGGILACVPNISEDLAYEVGRYLGRLHNTFQNTKVKDVDRLTRDDYILSLDKLHEMRSFLHHVPTEDDQQLIDKIITTWDSLEQKRTSLPTGIIHGDFNANNILVNEDSFTGEHKLTGAIDFQGMHNAPFVYDVGIFLMYLMTSASDKGQDYKRIASYALHGYMSSRHLSSSELSMLYYCIAARFVQSLVYGLRNYSLHKNPYTLRTQKSGWACLKELWSTNPIIYMRQLLFAKSEH